jgi:hypothetical protein
MKSVAEIIREQEPELERLVREREPDIFQIERERDIIEIQSRFHSWTGLLPAFPLDAEDLAALRIRDQIIRSSFGR